MQRAQLAGTAVTGTCNAAAICPALRLPAAMTLIIEKYVPTSGTSPRSRNIGSSYSTPLRLSTFDSIASKMSPLSSNNSMYFGMAAGHRIPFHKLTHSQAGEELAVVPERNRGELYLGGADAHTEGLS